MTVNIFLLKHIISNLIQSKDGCLNPLTCSAQRTALCCFGTLSSTKYRFSRGIWVLLETSGCMWEQVLDTVTGSEAVYFSHAPEGVLAAVRWKHLTHAYCTSKWWLSVWMKSVCLRCFAFVFCCVCQQPKGQTCLKNIF